jgi:uncharacterized protein (TIGR04222 family)
MFFPFDLDGPQFLVLHAALWLIALVAYGFYLGSDRGADPSSARLPLDAYHAAWLAGGARATFAAALTGLLERGLIEARGDTFVPTAEATQRLRSGRDLASVEAELLRLSGAGLESAWRGFQAAPLLLERELHEAGLWLPRRRLAEVAGPFAAVFVALLLLALARLAQGVATGYPVGFLVLELLVGGGLGLGLTQACARARPTRAGRQALADLRRRCAAPSAARPRLGTPSAAPDPALAVALFGTAVLVGGPHEALHRAVRPALASDGGYACTPGVFAGSSDGGSSDGGSSCGGGGCGGCGGS